MLDPSKRHVYLDALAPPSGYHLDRAIATTYTLDLTTLLVVPLSMALFPVEGGTQLLRDPIAVLEALSRNADRLTVFCQNGAIGAPSSTNRLFSRLESIVVQVAPTGGRSPGIFHPKTWFLRFVNDAGHVHYRFLCLSRNLTFDRSWDTMFSIEGPLETDGEPEARNTPLADFVRALPGLAVRDVPAAGREAVNLIVSELPYVHLRLQGWPRFDERMLRFHPLGIDGYRRWPFPDRSERIAVVSPFLTAGALRDLAGIADERWLISRQDELHRVGPRAVEPFGSRIYVLDDRVDDEEALPPGTETAGDEPEDAPTENAADDRRGLHAKLYLTQSGDQARLWTGSANATSALPGAASVGSGGRGRNVEFMVELGGPAKHFGLDAFLEGPGGKGGILDVVVPWRPTAEPSDEERLREALAQRATQVHRALIGAPMHLTATPTENRIGYALRLECDVELEGVEWASVTIRCWPVTQREDRAVVVDEDGLREGIEFGILDIASLTGFIAFSIQVKEGSVEHTTRFALNLPLEGAPADRDAHILRSIIADKPAFLRYLLFLLAEGDSGSSAAEALLAKLSDGGSSSNGAGGRSDDLPLLESLVRALARAPEKIGRIRRIVEDLRASEDGRERLPEDFDLIWGPIEAAWSARDSE